MKRKIQRIAIYILAIAVRCAFEHVEDVCIGTLSKSFSMVAHILALPFNFATNFSHRMEMNCSLSLSLPPLSRAILLNFMAGKVFLNCEMETGLALPFAVYSYVVKSKRCKHITII